MADSITAATATAAIEVTSEAEMCRSTVSSSASAATAAPVGSGGSANLASVNEKWKQRVWKVEHPNN